MNPVITAIIAGLFVERFKQNRDEELQPMIAPDIGPGSVTAPQFTIEGLNQPQVPTGIVEVVPNFEPKLAHMAAMAYLNTMRVMMEDAGLATLGSVQTDLKTQVDLSDAVAALKTGAKVAKLSAPLGPIASPAIGASVGFASWVAAAVKAASNFETVKSENDFLQQWWAVARVRLGAPPRSLFHFLTGVQLLNGRVVRHGLENPFDAVKWTAVALSAVDFCTKAGVNWKATPFWYPQQSIEAKRLRLLPVVDGNEYFYRKGYNNPGFIDKKGRKYKGFYWNFALLYDFLFFDCTSVNLWKGRSLKLTSQQVITAYIDAYKRRARGFEELALFNNADNAVFSQKLMESFSPGKPEEYGYKQPSVNCYIGREYGRGIRDDGGWNGRAIIETRGRGQSPATLVSDTQTG